MKFWELRYEYDYGEGYNTLAYWRNKPSDEELKKFISGLKPNQRAKLLSEGYFSGRNDSGSYFLYENEMIEN